MHYKVKQYILISNASKALFCTTFKPEMSQSQNTFMDLQTQAHLQIYQAPSFFLLHRKSLASSPPSFSGGYNLYSHRGVQDLRWIFVSAIYGIKKSILAFH